MSKTDTIFALTTAPAKSGVAIVRLSGPKAYACALTISHMTSLTPRHAHYASFYDPATEELIDNGLLLFFKAPHSFTGEDVIEMHLHGSMAVISQLHHVLNAMPELRVAEPGEFTRRAYGNGKMDLMEAEGLADLIDAQTSQQKSQALRQMEGELSHFFDTLRTDIIRSLAHLEAYIDFPDEEIPEEVLTGLSNDISAIQSSIKTALSDENRGERRRDGLTIAIIGAPNVGKSSLLNRIAKRDAAIVSQRAGTTRDAIEIHMDIKGYAAILIDTAGIHDSNDEIEQEGIRRAYDKAQNADINLVLFDGGQLPDIDSTSQKLLKDNSICIINKSDLIETPKAISTIGRHMPLLISTQSGEGINELLATLEKQIIHYFSATEHCYITRERHRSLLTQSMQSLEKAQKPLPLELKCEELRIAAQSIGEITGKIQVDDVLDVIFSSFCIGK